MRTKKNLITRIPLVVPLLAAVVIALIGCDTNDVADSSDTVKFQGRVTDQAGLGKRAEVEGAAVTAANVRADGSLKTLDGKAETDAQGNFSLDVNGAADVVVLSADKDDFHSAVLVVHDVSGAGTVQTVPMTTESEAEAEVYVKSVARGSEDESITAADVSAYVNERLASRWKAGATTSAEIVAALEASREAEDKYYEDDDDTEFDANKVRQEKRDNFLTLEASLSVAANASAQVAAINTFEEAMVKAYTNAGISLEVQAKARQAGLAALVKFYDESDEQARFALRQQVEILTSLSTAQAIEAEFEAAGASETRLSSLAELHADLVAALRAASSEGEIEVAQAEYEAGVNSEVMAELGVNAALLATVQTVLNPVEATLDASVASAGSAGAVASAYSTFYTTAEASAESTLATSSKASLGAKVLALLSGQ